MNKGITFKRVFNELLDLLEFKKGLPKTLLYLSYKPKVVIVGYIENFNGGFSGPFRIFYMCALIFIAYAFFSKSEVKNRLGDDFNEGTSWLVANYYDLESNKNAKPRERYQTSLDSSPQKNKIKKVSNFVNDSQMRLNPIYTLPFTLLLYSILTLLFCRNYFTNYLEHLCLNIYATSIVLILEYILFIIRLNVHPQWYWGDAAENLVSLMYCVFIYSRIFTWDNKYLKFLFIPIIALYNPSFSGKPTDELNLISVIGYIAQVCINNIHLPLLDYLYSR